VANQRGGRDSEGDVVDRKEERGCATAEEHMWRMQEPEN